LEDPDVKLRRLAAEAVWRIGPKASKAVPALIELLKAGEDAYAFVKESETTFAFNERNNLALLALVEMGAEARPALSEIMKGLKKANDEDVACFLKCLAKLGPVARDTLPELRLLLTQGKPPNRVFAAASILCIDPNDEPAKKILQGALKSNNGEMQDKALEACAQISPKEKELVPLLVDVLKNWERCEVAASALGLMGPLAEPAIPALSQVLMSKPAKPLDRVLFGPSEFGAYECTAQALAGIGKASIPGLAKIVGTRDAPGRAAATYALGELKKDCADAIPVLIKALDDEDVNIRMCAAVSLGRLRAVEAKQALMHEKSRKDDSAGAIHARILAAWALSQLER